MAANITNHATERALTRIAAAGLDGQKVLDVAATVAGKVQGSAAILMTTLPEQVGQSWGEESNGNQVWAVIRYRQVVTLMLRRSTQPATPENLRVDRVYRLQGK